MDDATIAKLEGFSISGASTTTAKQLEYVLHMLEYTYLLMVHPNNYCIKSIPFKPFIGRSVTLQKNRTKAAEKVKEE